MVEYYETSVKVYDFNRSGVGAESGEYIVMPHCFAEEFDQINNVENSGSYSHTFTEYFFLFIL